MNAAVTAALIAGLCSIAVALVSVALTVRSQTVTAATQARNELELTQLKAKLASQHDREAAHTEYEYEALKHLYADVNPLLFRLREQCAASLVRVRRIVREYVHVDSAQKVLTSTQLLIAPLVIAQELQCHLTAVDLRLDPTIRSQYTVARELLWILHEGPALAASEPRIDYRLESVGEKDDRQHLTFAQLQRVIDAISVSERDGGTRPMKLSELEAQSSRHDVDDALTRMRSLFANSSPATTPVLWRLLIAQACIMDIFVDLVDRSSAEVRSVLPANIEEYAWRDRDAPDFTAETHAVEEYVRARMTADGLVLRAGG